VFRFHTSLPTFSCLCIANHRQTKTSTEEDIGLEYEDVDFEDCIKTLTAKCEIERTCSQCQHNKATLQNSFITLPDVLIVTAMRFVDKNWVPTKIGIISISLPSQYLTLTFLSIVDVSLFSVSVTFNHCVPSRALTADVPLIVPREPFSLDKFLVPRGLQEGENPLPETSESTSSLADPVPS